MATVSVKSMASFGILLHLVLGHINNKYGTDNLRNNLICKKLEIDTETTNVMDSYEKACVQAEALVSDYDYQLKQMAMTAAGPEIKARCKTDRAERTPLSQLLAEKGNHFHQLATRLDRRAEKLLELSKVIAAAERAGDVEHFDAIRAMLHTDTACSCSK